MVGERKADEIGVMALRGGDVVGDHTVFFFRHRRTPGADP
jgi:4-hydroxy-tetrahydrodipicolinate reductase